MGGSARRSLGLIKSSQADGLRMQAVFLDFINEDEIGRLIDRCDLSGRGEADEQLASCSKTLFRHQYRK
jgi:hypothetical protein